MDLVGDHALAGIAAGIAVGIVRVAAHGEVGAGGIAGREAGYVHAGGLDGPEQGGLDAAGVVAAALAIMVEAGGVRLEIGEAVEAGADVRLEEREEGLEVLPVGTIVAGEEEGGLEAEGVGLADVVADILEALNNMPSTRPLPRGSGRVPTDAELVCGCLADPPV